MYTKDMLIMVDDEHLVHEVIEGQIERTCYREASFGDPRQALSRFNEHHQEVPVAIVDFTPLVEGLFTTRGEIAYE